MFRKSSNPNRASLSTILSPEYCTAPSAASMAASHTSHSPHVDRGHPETLTRANRIALRPACCFPGLVLTPQALTGSRCAAPHASYVLHTVFRWATRIAHELWKPCQTQQATPPRRRVCSSCKVCRMQPSRTSRTFDAEQGAHPPLAEASRALHDGARHLGCDTATRKAW